MLEILCFLIKIATLEFQGWVWFPSSFFLFHSRVRGLNFPKL